VDFVPHVPFVFLILVTQQLNFCSPRTQTTLTTHQLSGVKYYLILSHQRIVYENEWALCTASGGKHC